MVEELLTLPPWGTQFWVGAGAAGASAETVLATRASVNEVTFQRCIFAGLVYVPLVVYAKTFL